MGCTTPELRRLIVRGKKSRMKVKDICEIFNVSRWTVSRWVKRAYHPGVDSYRDLSRRPHTIHRKVTGEVEAAIIILRDAFNWGTHRIKLMLWTPPGYIRHMLEKAFGKPWEMVLISRQTVNNVLKKHSRNGYPPGGKREWKYFRAPNPNALWQMDIKGPFLIDGKRMLAIVIIDDYSRFMINIVILPTIETSDVTTVLSQSFKSCGKPKKILVDQGSQFREDFMGWCKNEGIEVLYTPKRYPQAKGKVERSIRNFNEEFLGLRCAFDNSSSLVEEYNRWYNYERYHLGIEDCPANLYFGANGANLT